MDDIHKKKGIDTLVSEIRRYLQEGIDLDPDTEALITKLTGHPITSIDTLLNGDSDDETEPVISLLMTPDTHLQATIEPLLWQFLMTPIEEGALIYKLGQHPPTVLIRLSKGSEVVQWTPPNWSIAEFIARLHLTWQVDSKLYQVTTRFLTASEKNRFWVSLRSAQIVLAPAISRNLATFVTQKDHFGETFFDYLDLLLTAWSDPNAYKEPYKVLARLKGSYIKALRQTHRFDIAARSHNMETLMLQGVPTPTITMETALHQISMIDNLTLTLFSTIVSLDDTPDIVSVTEKHLKQMLQ